ncbi:UNVERIFIED_CONTAM: hypothetical protein PYX00_006679 [Menopon gallinae]|uniref:Mitochondrial assembly of ribosomal large subunit protein 1 n=1 Tax=Menopon gallinae TaxID=328185 RepID=A0AAW2HWJ8_9NEOP
MLALNYLSKISRTGSSRLFVKAQRHFRVARVCREKDEKSPEEAPQFAASAASKYEIFNDERSVIFDIEQEREKYHEINEGIGRQGKERRDFSDISPERGKTGVIEIEELVKILTKENARDIFVVSVPKELSYVDYLVVVTCKSSRHMKAVIEFVRQVYKYKLGDTSTVRLPTIEGEISDDWKAIDIGNIALHVMSKSYREDYDLETLWSVGSKYDPKSNEKLDFDVTDYESILAKLMPSENTEVPNNSVQ